MTHEHESSGTPGLARLYSQARKKGYFIQEFTKPDGRFKSLVGTLLSYEEILGLTPHPSLKDHLFDFSLPGTGSTRGAAVRRAMVAWEAYLRTPR